MPRAARPGCRGARFDCCDGYEAVRRGREAGCRVHRADQNISLCVCVRTEHSLGLCWPCSAATPAPLNKCQAAPNRGSKQPIGPSSAEDTEDGIRKASSAGPTAVHPCSRSLRAGRQVDRPLPIEARSSAAIGPAEGRVCDGRSCSESCCEREGVLGERTRSFMRVPERGAVRVRHACNYSTEAHTLHITPVQFQNAT